MKPQTIPYQCKYCKTMEFIPKDQDGIKSKDITGVYCPVCFAKKKKRKMVIIE